MNNEHKANCSNRTKCVTLRWIMVDGKIRYTNDVVEGAKRAGRYQRCTNTIEDAPDLCDFTNPDHYLQLQSHNQPHKG